MGILRAERHVRLFELAAPEANMSDEPAEEEIDEMEPDSDLIDEEIDEEIEIDLEGDDLPESAFMYVGNLDDAKAKAEKMAAEAAG